jgi:hypothetical protein
VPRLFNSCCKTPACLDGNDLKAVPDLGNRPGQTG